MTLFDLPASSAIGRPARIDRSDVRPRDSFDHPVLQLLVARIASGSQPGERTDGEHLSLAVEGGGMRGVVAAGMLWALGQLDAFRAFDSVYATSAGAINAAYAVAGQCDWGASVYFEDVSNGRLVSTLGPLRRRSLLSLDYLIWEVAGDTKRLDFDGLMSSGVTFHVIATDCRRGEPVVLSEFPDREALLRSIQASCSFPRVTGEPLHIDGRVLVDGTFSEAIPFRAAREGGATHVLALRSRPSGAVRNAPGALRKAGTRLFFHGVDRDIVELELTRWRPYRDAVQTLARHTADPSLPDPLYEIALPAGSDLPSQLCTDREELVAAFRAGAEQTFDLLTDGARLVETAAAFRAG